MRVILGRFYIIPESLLQLPDHSNRIQKCKDLFDEKRQRNKKVGEGEEEEKRKKLNVVLKLHRTDANDLMTREHPMEVNVLYAKS